MEVASVMTTGPVAHANHALWLRTDTGARIIVTGRRARTMAGVLQMEAVNAWQGLPEKSAIVAKQGSLGMAATWSAPRGSLVTVGAGARQRGHASAMRAGEEGIATFAVGMDVSGLNVKSSARAMASAQDTARVMASTAHACATVISRVNDVISAWPAFSGVVVTSHAHARSTGTAKPTGGAYVMRAGQGPSARSVHLDTQVVSARRGAILKSSATCRACA